MEESPFGQLIKETQPGLPKRRWLSGSSGRGIVKPMISIVPLILSLTYGTWNMNAAHSGNDLELSIRTERPRYAVGESIVLEIGLRNTAEKAVNVLKYFLLPADVPDKNTLEIRVQDAEGNRIARVSHVLTGRSLYHPEIRNIASGETYRESLPLAGKFEFTADRKKEKRALWSFGENPEVTSASEYPRMTRGTFRVQVIYRVTQAHLASMAESQRGAVWTGELMSNSLEISVF